MPFFPFLCRVIILCWCSLEKLLKRLGKTFIPNVTRQFTVSARVGNFNREGSNVDVGRHTCSLNRYNTGARAYAQNIPMLVELNIILCM